MAVEAKAKFREVTADGKLMLRMHAGQWRAWEAKERFVCVLAGTQGGKTVFGPHWLHREITEAAKKLSPDALEGVGDFLAVSSTYDLFKIQMLPSLVDVFVDILKIGRYWAVDKVIELSEGLRPVIPGDPQSGRFLAEKSSDRMWGRIILRSADAEAGLESATCRAAWLDEAGQPAFRLTAWEAVLRRLSIARGRVLITTTIYTGGWLKTEVYDRWKAGDKDYAVIQFDSTDNPAFSQEEFERARRTIAPAKFEMFYRGRFAKQAGLVYDCFDSAAQVIDPFPIPDSWRWYVGHDFGPANPAALAYAQDPATGLLYLAHEYLPGPRSVHDVVEDLKDMLKGRTVVRRVGGNHAEQGIRDAHTAQGWPILEPSERSVDAGITKVYSFHKRAAILVFRSCRLYLDEIASYSYKLGEDSSVTDNIENKSAYHLLDAERYLLTSFPDEMARRKRDAKTEAALAAIGRAF